MNPHRLIHGLLAGAALVLVLAAASGPTAAATLDLQGPEGAIVSLGDRVLGAFPLSGPLELPPGRYVVQCRLPGHVPYSQPVRLDRTDSWQRLVVRLTPFSRRTAWSSNLLLAGLGQRYLGHGFRGTVYGLAEAGGLLTALYGELMRSNQASDYREIVRRYDAAIDVDDIATLRAEAAAKFQDMNDSESLRDTGLIVAGGAVVVSVIDALLSFPAVESGAGTVPVRTSAVESPWGGNDGPEQALHAGLSLRF